MKLQNVMVGAFFLSLLFLPRDFLPAQSLGSGVATKENLDLPFDALGEGEEEEDAPEVVIFYGTQLEGDAFFYAVDRSSSMKDAELPIAKREIIKNISEFSNKVQFGVVFFDANVTKFPASGQPTEANPGMKQSAINFVQAIQAGQGSCCQQGIMAALNMANFATAKRKVITYVGDGGGTCNGADEATYLRQTLAAVTAANYTHSQINAIGVLQQPKLNEDFLKNLATSNNGTYTKITR